MGNIDKSALAGMAMLGAMVAEPALAENQKIDPIVTGAVGSVSHQVDCKVLARNHDGTGKEKLKVYSDCRDGVLQAETAELENELAKQKHILAALNKMLADQQIRIDEQGRILNELGEELARVVSINGKLIIRRQQAHARSEAALDEAERYILENS